MSDIIEILFAEDLDHSAKPLRKSSMHGAGDEPLSERLVGELCLRKVPIAAHVSRRILEGSGREPNTCWSARPEDVLLLKDAAFGYGDTDIISSLDEAFKELVRGAPWWAVVVETDKGSHTAFTKQTPDRVIETVLKCFHPGFEPGHGCLIILPD